MTRETCILCKEEDCTPWKYIAGHICSDCSEKFDSARKCILCKNENASICLVCNEKANSSLLKLSYLLGTAATIIASRYEDKNRIDEFFNNIKELFYKDINIEK